MAHDFTDEELHDALREEASVLREVGSSGDDAADYEDLKLLVKTADKLDAAAERLKAYHEGVVAQRDAAARVAPTRMHLEMISKALDNLLPPKDRRDQA